MLLIDLKLDLAHILSNLKTSKQAKKKKEIEYDAKFFTGAITYQRALQET